MIAGIIPPKRETIAIEKILVALIPKRPNRLIIVASLVPRPLIVMGIWPTSVARGIIAKK